METDAAADGMRLQGFFSDRFNVASLAILIEFRIKDQN